jgi:hypothetical protein
MEQPPKRTSRPFRAIRVDIAMSVLSSAIPNSGHQHPGPASDDRFRPVAGSSSGPPCRQGFRQLGGTAHQNHLADARPTQHDHEESCEPNAHSAASARSASHTMRVARLRSGQRSTVDPSAVTGGTGDAAVRLRSPCDSNCEALGVRNYMNSAPICDPRRHLTRARRPKLASRDIKRVKTPVTVSAARTVIWTPVSERSTILHGRIANPPSKRIHAFAPLFLRAALR